VKESKTHAITKQEEYFSENVEPMPDKVENRLAKEINKDKTPFTSMKEDENDLLDNPFIALGYGPKKDAIKTKDMVNINDNIMKKMLQAQNKLVQDMTKSQNLDILEQEPAQKEQPRSKLEKPQKSEIPKNKKISETKSKPLENKHNHRFKKKTPQKSYESSDSSDTSKERTNKDICIEILEEATNFKIKGHEKFKQKNYKEAVTFYERAERVIDWDLVNLLPHEKDLKRNCDKIYASVVSNLGKSYIELKNYKKAVTNFEKLIEFDPSQPRNYYVCSLCYQHQEKMGSAFDTLKVGLGYAKNSKDKTWLVKYTQMFNDIAKEISNDVFDINKELTETILSEIY